MKQQKTQKTNLRILGAKQMRLKRKINDKKP